MSIKFKELLQRALIPFQPTLKLRLSNWILNFLIKITSLQLRGLIKPKVKIITKLFRSTCISLENYKKIKKVESNL